ncbi:hypothetical protein ACFS4T_03345 [Pseudomonas lini]
MVGWSSKWTNNLFYGLMVLPGLVLLIKQRGSGLFKQPLVWVWTAFILWFLVPATIAGQFQFFKHVFYVWMFVMVIGAFTDPQFFSAALCLFAGNSGFWRCTFFWLRTLQLGIG